MNMKIDLIDSCDQACIVARQLFAEFEKETVLGQIALSHAIHNRLLKKERIRNILQDEDFDTGETIGISVLEMKGSNVLKALSVVAGAFAGLSDDPTDGATRFHRHDRYPVWARGHQAIALLGERFYYRL